MGKAIAERAKAKGVKEVVFDRGGYPYHGRVKALADGSREGGLRLLGTRQKHGKEQRWRTHGGENGGGARTATRIASERDATS